MSRVVVAGHAMRQPVGGSNLTAFVHHVLGLHRLGHGVIWKGYLKVRGQSCSDRSVCYVVRVVLQDGIGSWRPAGAGVFRSRDCPRRPPGSKCDENEKKASLIVCEILNGTKDCLFRILS
jgi:hypothetical protein